MCCALNGPNSVKRSDNVLYNKWPLLGKIKTMCLTFNGPNSRIKSGNVLYGKGPNSRGYVMNIPTCCHINPGYIRRKSPLDIQGNMSDTEVLSKSHRS